MGYLIVPATTFSALEAVNMLIATLGESPVDSIDPPTHEDAAAALSALNVVDLLLQSNGWSWNSETDYPLTTDADNKLPLPDLCMEAQSGTTEFTYKNVHQRGSFLYNADTRSFVFPAGTTVKANLVVRQEWDNLPAIARVAITYRAAQQFQSEKDGSQVVLQVNAASVRDSWATLLSLEDRNDPQNTLASFYTEMMLNGPGGLIRNRQGIR